MKSYRYIIYKLYTWAMRRSNDTPVFNVVVTLTAVHYFQLLILYCILLRFFNVYNIFTKDNSLFVGLFSIAFIILNYFIFYNKKRWDNYIKEFAAETKEDSRRKGIYVLCYIIGSILLFFISLPLLFGLGR